MARPPRTGVKNGATRLTVADIRNELYYVKYQIRMLQNDHLAAFQGEGEKHPDECACCKRCNSEIDGIKRAIRHFGGNPHRGW